MSKLSVHITQPGNANGYGEEFLGIPAMTGNPVAMVYQLNGNTKADVIRYSPTTKLVFRKQSDVWARVPDGMFTSDPRKNCEDWMLNFKENGLNLLDYWKLNPCDYYDPLNEPVVGTPSQARWLNDWMIRALEIANEYGYKLALFSFSDGSPEYDLWQYLFGALRLGKQSGSILSLHEYGIEYNLIERNPDGSLTENTIHNSLRHRKIWELLPEDCRIPILVSECGCGNGYAVPLTGDAYLNDAIEYDKEIMKDSYVIAGCLFQLGGKESNLVPVLGKLASYIAITPTELPTIPPPPPQTVLPYVVVTYLAPQNATVEQMIKVQLEAYNTKSTVCQSADDARQLVKMGMCGSKAIIYDPQSWPGGEAGILKYFEGLTTELKYFTPPPSLAPLRGVGTGTQNLLNPVEKTAIVASKVNSVLLMTLQDVDEARNLVRSIKEINSEITIIGRLFFSADPINKTKFNPADFVSFCKNGLDGFYREGVRYFQIHNEPNLEVEGYGWNWTNGKEFSTWLNGVLSILRVQYPEAKWGYPGLSPQPNTEAFWADSRPAMENCDWVGVHAYWQHRGTTGWGMESLDGGLHYKRLTTSKPLMITEFSNNSKTTPLAEKGAQYKDYYKLVNIPAYSFCLSWYGDENREGWVQNGILTDIPKVIGL